MSGSQRSGVWRCRENCLVSSLPAALGWGHDAWLVLEAYHSSLSTPAAHQYHPQELYKIYNSVNKMYHNYYANRNNGAKAIMDRSEHSNSINFCSHTYLLVWMPVTEQGAFLNECCVIQTIISQKLIPARCISECTN